MLSQTGRNGPLWTLCVSCAFLVYAPGSTTSFSTGFLPPAPALERALGGRALELRGPQLRMCFGPDGSSDASGSPRPDHASPARGRQLWGSASSGRSARRVGDVLRVRPSADNGWHETRQVLRRESPFVHALMYGWPTGWLRAERHLYQFARVLRDEAPVGDPEADKEDSKSDGEDPDAPFDVGQRYRIAGQAGRGAFSVVKIARDLGRDEQVAIKRVQDAAPDAAQLRRLLRELGLLRRVRGHSNVMAIRDILVKKRTVHAGFLDPKPSREVTDVYIITELMMSDLGRMLDHETTLTTEQARCLMFQLLSGLQHVHDTGIMHRDIKPSNCLVDKMWRLKICDLGIARESSRQGYIGSIYEDPDAKFTDYVVTRPYRSPELLMGSRMYDGSVDMWSAGCILAELLAGQEPVDIAPMARTTARGRIRLPLFPGADHKDMVKRIVSVLGHPSDDELKILGKWEPKAVKFVESQPYPHCDLETQREVHGVESVGERCMIPILAPCNDEEEKCPLDPVDQKPVDWHEVFPWADPDALDLLKKLLQYDPSRRPTAAQALAHRFFAKAAPPRDASGASHGTSELDVGTAFKRAAVRSSVAPTSLEGGGAGFFDKFWEECDQRIWDSPDAC